ncbi:MAG: DUF2628 domain-containing protein, partial [Pseudomonas sp.]
DPYNSYQGPTVPAPVAAAPPARVSRDVISGLDVSDKWKDRFRAIERAGGPRLPKFHLLSSSERRSIQFNWLAFIFGPFYFLAKGLWRQTVVYVLIGIALALVLDALGMDKVIRALGFGFSAVYAIRANISYYKKVAEDEAPWL